MLEYDFDESIGVWLTLATHAYHQTLNDKLAPHGITSRQATALGYLALEGEMSQSELARRMAIEPPTLAGVLERMEKAGWITRHACPVDRRKRLVRAHPSAEPAWSKIVQCARDVRAKAGNGLSKEELTALRALLERIRGNLMESAPDAAATVPRPQLLD
jgi:MarR family transcriptional regulator for hemolysin